MTCEYKLESILFMNKVIDEIDSIGPIGKKLTDSLVWDMENHTITTIPFYNRPHYKFIIQEKKGKVSAKVLNCDSNTSIFYYITSKKMEFEVLYKIKNLAIKVLQGQI